MDINQQGPTSPEEYESARMMLERLFCAALGHRYVVERVLNHGARKVGCTRCGRHWAMHDETRSFVEWDGEFEAFYAPGGILAEVAKDAPSNAGVKAAGEASPATERSEP